MSLSTELANPEYQALTNAERLALLLLKTERVVGKIAYGNTLHLVSMLARGLRQRINDCPIASLRNAWQEALQPAYLASPAYSINVALTEIRGMLTAGLQAGVCTQAEHDFIVELASYDKQLFPDAKLSDVVAHFNPELIDGEWHELPETMSIWFVLKLATKAPEMTHVVIQAKDNYNGSESDWYHCTALHGIELAREYKAALPSNGYYRKLRWKCEYNLDGVVSV